MLNRLRWQLTALYTLCALGMILLIGAGSYALLQYYFRRTTDLALEYKMAAVFQSYGLPLPSELAASEQAWLDSNRSAPIISKTSTPTALAVSGGDGEIEDEGENEGSAPNQPESESQEYGEAYDGSLSAIFVLPNNGAQSAAQNQPAAPIIQDTAAAQQAMQSGSDLRTVLLKDGSRVRLLSYRTSASGTPPVVQVGRLLIDQDRVLNGFYTGLLILGGLAIILLGFGSWWLSGRTLTPAQRAWEQQQVFISNASHELRTPLTLIRASTEYALRSPSTPEQSELLQNVLQDCDYMNRLVDDLLLLSRLDTHRLQLEKAPIGLPALLADLQEQFGRLAEAKGVTLSVSQAQGTVWGDPTRLRQVILILLDNALRHTPPGGSITINTRMQARFVEIVVADTGRGIPAANLPHIFERFYQVNQPGDNESRSNGLGLSIAKGLIDAQEGSITLESQVGVGTRVTIRMPAAPQAA
jgi:signal transduction histidine kinase